VFAHFVHGRVEHELDEGFRLRGDAVETNRLGAVETNHVLMNRVRNLRWHGGDQTVKVAVEASEAVGADCFFGDAGAVVLEHLAEGARSGADMDSFKLRYDLPRSRAVCASVSQNRAASGLCGCRYIERMPSRSSLLR
jgi:hypothetical protein